MPGFNDVPFNFVPLNHEVFIPEWGYKISQDVPFEDGEDGIISLEITNTTPLFIKNGIGESGEDTMSASIVDAEGHRHYYIPATSLKGMLRSVLEILSFSKMKQYNDDYFGYRNFDTRLTGGKSYVEKMKASSCGWLTKKWTKDGKDKYLLLDCGEFQRIEMSELPKYYEDVKNNDLVKKVEHFRKLGRGTYPVVTGKRLVCTGYMHNKKNEYLFPDPSNSTELEVDNKIISAFLSVYKPSKAYYKFINDMLKSEEPLAVFFTKSGNKIEAMGITRMFRYPYKHSVSDGVNQNSKEGLDLSECIFGYTSHTKSLRGRAQLGNAFAVGEINGIEERKGVLGQPNASYYPYYLHQNGPQYDTYSSNNIEIAGRKRYRVHAHNNITELPQGNGKENNMQPRPMNLLAAGNRFECKIKVHNLRPVEIGALLSAITFHGHRSCHHNIGMAKAMGYGRLDVSAIQLQYLAHNEMYYMAEFEKHMSRFNLNWINSAQVRALLQIATEHNGEFGYMDFDGYKEGKRNNNFSQLVESTITPQSLLSTSELCRLRFPDKYEAIEKCFKEGKYNEVFPLCDELERALKPNMDSSIENYRSEARNKRIEQETEEASRNEQAELEEKRRHIESGLGAFIDEKYPNGEYKVKNFKVAISKTAKYLKDKRTVTGEESLSEEELLGLQRSLLRIYKSITKQRDQKEWTNPDSGKWCELAKLVGDSEKNKIYEKIMV